MDSLKFKVSAELKNILGKDLITSPNIAILELVKNSYDAHATKVEITFEDNTLTIADNGKGMSKSDLINKWLFVAYSAKSDGTEDKTYRSKFTRHYAGAKGIGRLSCDSLARNLTLITRSEDKSTEILYVDWGAFEDSKQKEFDTIIVPHESQESIPVFPLESQTGTILKFTNLRISWDVAAILQLKKSLEKMINPFSGVDSFSIEVIVPSELATDKDKYGYVKQQSIIFDQLSFEEKTKLAATRNSIVNGIIENSIADVLKLKTTQIESSLKEGKIITKLSDRGELMYSIEEVSTFDKLDNIAINLFYLNRAAKYNFSLMMGVTPVNYGSIFLFRNGIRVWPYGEAGDDSWNLDKRAKQGYNRFLGTRDLFGRVDVLTRDVDSFKEVSSRDGGLIMTPASVQLMQYFEQVHRRLERYVSGVLWGESFVRNDYFKNLDDATKIRKLLQEAEKDSETPDHVHENIGSKIDFLQIIKSLVNDSNVVVTYYNERLANIVENVSDTEIIQSKLIDDLRKVAQKTSDEELHRRINEFELQLAEMRLQKEDAERKIEEERIKTEKARKQAEAEKAAREKAEKERDAQIQKNKYLSSTRDTSKEVMDLMHTVLISSTELASLVKYQKILLQEEDVDKLEMNSVTNDIEFNVERIHVLSSLITKADTSILRESMDVDVLKYTTEFLSFFGRTIHVDYVADSKQNFVKKIPVLEYSIILQNIVSNAKKAEAENILIKINRVNLALIIEFSDDGNGVDLTRFTKDTIFEEGVTNRKGGHGIGLSTIRETLQRSMNGNIEFVDNNLNGLKGATFRLILQ